MGLEHSSSPGLSDSEVVVAKVVAGHESAEEEPLSFRNRINIQTETPEKLWEKFQNSFPVLKDVAPDGTDDIRINSEWTIRALVVTEEERRMGSCSFFQLVRDFGDPDVYDASERTVLFDENGYVNEISAGVYDPKKRRRIVRKVRINRTTDKNLVNDTTRISMPTMSDVETIEVKLERWLIDEEQKTAYLNGVMVDSTKKLELIYNLNGVRIDRKTGHPAQANLTDLFESEVRTARR